jgi:hypothetical protein
MSTIFINSFWQATWYAGLTDLVAVYQPKGAASLAASYVNLVNPGTYNAAPGTAPTFAEATGWTFAAASTQYLTTGIVPASGWSMLVRFSGVSNNGALAGAWTSGGNTYFYLLPNNTSDSKHYYGGGTFLGVPGLHTVGVMAIAGVTGYLNGVSDATMTAWSGTATRQITIGAFNAGASPSFFLSGNIQAIAICSSVQSAGQIAAASAAVALI